MQINDGGYCHEAAKEILGWTRIQRNHIAEVPPALALPANEGKDRIGRQEEQPEAVDEQVADESR